MQVTMRQRGRHREPDMASLPFEMLYALLNGCDSTAGRPYLNPLWRFTINRVSHAWRFCILNPPQQLVRHMSGHYVAAHFGVARWVTGRIACVSAISDALGRGHIDLAKAMQWLFTSGIARETVDAALLASAHPEAVEMGLASFGSKRDTTAPVHLPWLRHHHKANSVCASDAGEASLYGMPLKTLGDKTRLYPDKWNAHLTRPDTRVPMVPVTDDSFLLIACRCTHSVGGYLIAKVVSAMSKPPGVDVFRLCVSELARRNDTEALDVLIDGIAVLCKKARHFNSLETYKSVMLNECLYSVSPRLIDWLLCRRVINSRPEFGDSYDLRDCARSLLYASVPKGRFADVIDHIATLSKVHPFDLQHTLRYVFPFMVRRGAITACQRIVTHMVPFAFWTANVTKSHGVLFGSEAWIPFNVATRTVRGIAWFLNHVSAHPDKAWGMNPASDPIEDLVAATIDARPLALRWRVLGAAMVRWPFQTMEHMGADRWRKYMTEAIDNGEWRFVDRLLTALYDRRRERDAREPPPLDLWSEAVRTLYMRITSHVNAPCPFKTLATLVVFVHRCNPTTATEMSHRESDRAGALSAGAWHPNACVFRRNGRFYAVGPEREVSGSTNARQKWWRACGYAAVRAALIEPVAPPEWGRWCRPTPLDGDLVGCVRMHVPWDQVNDFDAMVAYLCTHDLVRK